jgi:integral membrane protein
MNNYVKKFRLIGMIEGYSFLLLLFIAMPLKYFAGLPMAVKIVGMTHGILFILFCLLLVKAWQEAEWSFKENAIFFIASLVPFGTFFTDKKIKSYE